jgi:hypothetical protein
MAVGEALHTQPADTLPGSNTKVIPVVLVTSSSGANCASASLPLMIALVREARLYQPIAKSRRATFDNHIGTP